MRWFHSSVIRHRQFLWNWVILGDSEWQVLNSAGIMILYLGENNRSQSHRK